MCLLWCLKAFLEEGTFLFTACASALVTVHWSGRQTQAHLCTILGLDSRKSLAKKHVLWIRKLAPTPESTCKSLAVAEQPMVFPIKEIFGPKKLDDFPDRFLFARSLLDQFRRRKRFPPVRGASFLSVLIAHISYLLCIYSVDFEKCKIFGQVFHLILQLRFQ